MNRCLPLRSGRYPRHHFHESMSIVCLMIGETRCEGIAYWMKHVRSLLVPHRVHLMKYVDIWTTVDLLP